VYLLEFLNKGDAKVKSLPKMTQKRCWHSVVYSKPYAYILCGYDGAQRLKHCEKINVLNPVAYEPMKSMNEERSLFGCTLYGENKIFVCGGSTAKKNASTDSIEIYNILEDKWVFSSVHLPMKLYGLSCISVEEKSKVLIFGGGDACRNYTKLVCEYDMEKKILRECNQMMKKRQMNNKVFKKNDKIFIVGGNSDCDWEIWNQTSGEGECITEKELISYQDMIKNDLNIYSGFMI